MKHARDDYDRIQDPSGKIPANEPVFLIRGQDLAGPDTLREWCRLAHKNGADNAIIHKVLDQARAMEAWQRNVARKTPDMRTPIEIATDLMRRMPDEGPSVADLSDAIADAVASERAACADLLLMIARSQVNDTKAKVAMACSDAIRNRTK